MKVWMRLALASALAAAVAGCAETQMAIHTAKSLLGGSASRPETPPVAATAPTSQPGVKIGQPYQIAGVWYTPREEPDYDERGIASWYGPGFHGRPTANGETYDENGVSAAHPTLPLPSWVRVTNYDNGHTLVVRVNDRGPFKRGRILDLSRGAATRLGVIGPGTARVRVQNVTHLYNGTTALAAAPGAAATRTEVVSAAPLVPVAREPLTSSAEGADAPLSVSAATPTRTFVQAGAFRDTDNARRLEARLAHLGPVETSATEIETGTFYRVRLGPLASVEDADAVLARVIAAGHSGARIVVETSP